MCSKWAVNFFMFFLEIGIGKSHFVANHIHERDNHWKVVNVSFEEGLNSNEDLQRFNGKMFYVWDNNHRL
jgi:hypothetical protein